MKLLLCTLSLIALGSPAPKHYLIETAEGALKEDLELLADAVDKAAMEEVVEKVSEDVIDALEGEKTYGEMIEDGKEDLKLLSEAVDGEKVKQVAEKVYSDVARDIYSEDGQDYIFDQIGQMLSSPLVKKVLNNPVAKQLMAKIPGLDGILGLLEG